MKKTKYLLFAISIIIIIYLFIPNNELKDDYYNYINKNTIKKHKLTEDKYTWSIFEDTQNKVDKRRDEIIKEIKDNNNLTILYNKLSNTEERNKEGLSSLNKYLKLIDNTNNIEEYINNAITIENDLNIDLITNIKVAKDFKKLKTPKH